MPRRLLLAALAVLLAVPAGAEDVVVFAASSLTDALQQVAARFEAAAGHHVVLSFGASSELARQVRAGAGADFFLSADAAQMDALARAGLVQEADRFDLLSNALAVIVPLAASVVPQRAADLLAVKRLALADPESVPAGVYAREYLMRQKVWDALQPRVIPALDVRAALAIVENGHADAGIVYRTDTRSRARIRVAYLVPAADAPRIVYPAALLARSTSVAARQFAAFLRTPEARALFEEQGFGVIAPR
jgi:molybdate transport system substrate-binding protein